LDVLVNTQRTLPLNYVLIPWTKVLLEKLTGLQLVKKSPRIFWSPAVGKFITAFKIACYPTLSWARSIQLIPPSHFVKKHL